MSIDKNYVGKVVRMEFTMHKTPQTKVGYVFDQKTVNTTIGQAVEFSVCLTNGSEWNPRFFPDEDLKISSVRMDKEMRDALKAYGSARIAQNTFLKKFEEQKKQHEALVNQARNAVKSVSKDMTLQEMMHAVEELFREAFPSSGQYHVRHFDCTSCGSKELTMTQVQDIEKWATPEMYSFLYREYDQTVHVRHDSKEFKAFCEKYAPPVIPVLRGYKSSVGGAIGDKNWLTAGRSYTIPLKYGLSKDSLQDIKDVLSGKSLSSPSVKKPSLDSAIKSASFRTEKKPADKTAKSKENQR